MPQCARTALTGRERTAEASIAETNAALGIGGVADALGGHLAAMEQQ